MNTTLGQVKAGDRVLSIGKLTADKVTTGIAWTDQPQELVVKFATIVGKNVMVGFDNGGRLLPAPSVDYPCTIA